jgi:hypothetical protein
MNFDYAGAEALISVLESPLPSDRDIDKLLEVHGVAGMVDNVTRFVPGVGRAEFRKNLRSFIEAKRQGGGSSDNRNFELDDVWASRAQVVNLIIAIKTREREIVRQTLAELERLRPNTGPLHITVYFVAGGVSDGFAPGSETAFYINLARSNGDLNGVVSNITHEAYHVMQAAAMRKAGLSAIAGHPENLPSPERLLASTLREGTANYAADATRSTASGPYIEMWRSRFQRNAAAPRIKENFALFDTVLSDLLSGRMTWQQANRVGFSGNNDARFYFVGYQMAKAIERYYGRKCVGELFAKPPVEFFRQYIALYRKHSDITARFAPETEALAEKLKP